MNPRLLALGIVLGGAAGASVTLPDGGSSPWKAVADRVHSSVIEVHGEEGVNIVSSGTGSSPTWGRSTRA